MRDGISAPSVTITVFVYVCDRACAVIPPPCSKRIVQTRQLLNHHMISFGVSVFSVGKATWHDFGAKKHVGQNTTDVVATCHTAAAAVGDLSSISAT